MRIVFKRAMMQKFRVIASLIGPIIDAGHSLRICVKGTAFTPNQWRNNPPNVGQSSQKSIRYIADNFGIPIRRMEDVKFTRKKNYYHNCDMLIKMSQQEKRDFVLPYLVPHCRYKGKKYLTGDPLLELMREKQRSVATVPNSLLIVHPGGCRGFISPWGKPYSRRKTRENNIRFIDDITKHIPPWITTISIKSHPVPFHQCTAEAMRKYLSFPIIETNLCEAIARHEWVVNIGSSTAFWLKGSGKKWLNLVGLAKFKYKFHRENLAEQRGGATDYTTLTQSMEDYARTETQKEKDIFEMPATENIINLINRVAK